MAYKLTDEDRQYAQQMALQRVGQIRPPQPQAVQQPKKQKGFWLDQISTGGGIGGALAGGAAGATIGSAVPIVGTAIGGLAGALLGGALGSGGGEMVENSISGDDLWKNVGSEALIGGATSLPIGAGLKLARAGLKATTGVGEAAAGDLVEQAGLQTIPKRTIAKLVDSGKVKPETLDSVLKVGAAPTSSSATKTSFAGKLETRANKALADQYGPISKPMIREANPAKTIPQLAEFGITKPEEAERLARELTGLSGKLNQIVVNASDGARSVDTKGLREIFVKAADDAGLIDNERKAAESIFRGKMGILNGGSAGSLGGATSSDALRVIRELERESASLLGRDGRHHIATTADKRQSKVLEAVRDEIENRLYGAAGANANLKAQLTPQVRDELLALNPGNKKWVDYVDNKVMKATNVGQIRSAQAPFVNISKIINDADNNAFSVGGKMVTNTQGIKDALMQGAANLVANPARRGFATAVKDGMPSLGRTAGVNPVGQGAVSLGTRQAVGRAMAPGQDANELDQGQLPESDSPLFSENGNQNPNSSSTAQVEQVNPLGYSSTQIAQALMAAYADGNSKAAGQLEGMYQLASEWEQAQAKATAPQEPGFGKPTAQQYSQANTGLQSLNQLANMLQGNPELVNKAAIPGQDLPIIGSLQSGALGTSEYKSAGNNILNSIARINTGANMPRNEEGFYRKTYLPQPGDSQETIRMKMQNLYEFFNPIANYRSSGTSASDLAGALQSAGYQ